MAARTETHVGCRSGGGGADRLHELRRFLPVVAEQEQGEGDAAEPGGPLRRVRPFEQGVVVRSLRPDIGAPLAQIGELDISLECLPRRDTAVRRGRCLGCLPARQ